MTQNFIAVPDSIGNDEIKRKKTIYFQLKYKRQDGKKKEERKRGKKHERARK